MRDCSSLLEHGFMEFTNNSALAWFSINFSSPQALVQSDDSHAVSKCQPFFYVWIFKVPGPFPEDSA